MLTMLFAPAHPPGLLRPLLCALLLAGAAGQARACVDIADAAERLSCYDRRQGAGQLVDPAPGRQGAGQIVDPAPGRQGAGQTATPPGQQDPLELPPAVLVPPSPRREEPCVGQGWHTGARLRSPLAWRWDLDRCERARSVFLPHRPNYFLPLIASNSINKDPWLDMGDDAAEDADRFRRHEASFQLSAKVRLLRDVLQAPLDVWAAYTQRSFWQVYSPDVSSPVRESNYEPELIFNWRLPWLYERGMPRYISLGLNHQSNGRSDVLSRSWNRVWLEMGFDGPDYMVLVRPWWRLPTEDTDEDTPALENWMGRAQITAAWQWRHHVFSAELTNNLLWPNNRGSMLLGWTWPLTDRVKTYVQYFNGYGSSLLDYRHKTESVGFGLLLGDWL